MDNDGYVSNGELFQVLKMMVGSNLKDTQLQQIVDKTIILYDKVSLKKFSFTNYNFMNNWGCLLCIGIVSKDMNKEKNFVLDLVTFIFHRSKPTSWSKYF